MSAEVLLVNNQLGPAVSFGRTLASMGRRHVTVDSDEFDPASLDGRFGAVILTGTDIAPHLDFARYERVAALVETADIPVLGVCGGHLIIALAHGARVVETPTPIYGRTQMDRVVDDGLLTAVPERSTVFAKHRYCIEEAPGGFVTAARESRFGIPYVIAHRRRSVFGVQFHPERRQQGRIVLQAFLELADDEVESST